MSDVQLHRPWSQPGITPPSRPTAASGTGIQRRLDRRDEPFAGPRLADKPAMLRECVPFDVVMAGRKQKANPWPAVSDQLSQFEAIHTAGHIDI
ncbi:hypothetical protein NRB_50020 [Novosphingobium sp. 11B]